MNHTSSFPKGLHSELANALKIAGSSAVLQRSHHAYVQLAGNIRESYQDKTTLTVTSVLA